MIEKDNEVKINNIDVNVYPNKELVVKLMGGAIQNKFGVSSDTANAVAHYGIEGLLAANKYKEFAKEQLNELANSVKPYTDQALQFMGENTDNIAMFGAGMQANDIRHATKAVQKAQTAIAKNGLKYGTKLARGIPVIGTLLSIAPAVAGMEKIIHDMQNDPQKIDAMCVALNDRNEYVKSLAIKYKDELDKGKSLSECMSLEEKKNFLSYRDKIAEAQDIGLLGAMTEGLDYDIEDNEEKIRDKVGGVGYHALRGLGKIDGAFNGAITWTASALTPAANLDKMLAKRGLDRSSILAYQSHVDAVWNEIEKGKWAKMESHLCRVENMGGINFNDMPCAESDHEYYAKDIGSGMGSLSLLEKVIKAFEELLLANKEIAYNPQEITMIGPRMRG